MSVALIPTLKTERLVLRGPELADLPALTAFFESDDSHFVGGPMSAGDTQRAMLATIGSWALYGFGLWHIAEAETGRMLGWTGLLQRIDKPEPGFAGAVFTQDQRQGYAIEAGRTAMGYIRSTLGHDTPATFIEHTNAPSLELARKLGFALEAESESDFTLRFDSEAA